MINDTLNTKKAILYNNVEALIKKNVENTLSITQKSKIVKKNLLDLKRTFNILNINLDLNSAIVVLNLGDNDLYSYKISFKNPTYKDININNYKVRFEIKNNYIISGVYYAK